MQIKISHKNQNQRQSIISSRKGWFCPSLHPCSSATAPNTNTPSWASEALKIATLKEGTANLPQQSICSIWILAQVTKHSAESLTPTCAKPSVDPCTSSSHSNGPRVLSASWIRGWWQRTNSPPSACMKLLWSRAAGDGFLNRLLKTTSALTPAFLQSCHVLPHLATSSTRINQVLQPL